MKTHLLLAFCSLLALQGCGEKDAEYYVKHPEELKTVLEDCYNKAQSVQQIEKIEPLYRDKVCQAAMRAFAAVGAGSLEKAILAEPENGYWHNALKKREKEIEEEARLAALREVPWRDFIKSDDFINISGMWCGTDPSCITREEISELKRKEAAEELSALSWEEIKRLRGEACKDPVGVLCKIHREAEEKKTAEEIPALSGEEIKRRRKEACKEPRGTLCNLYREAEGKKAAEELPALSREEITGRREEVCKEDPHEKACRLYREAEEKKTAEELSALSWEEIKGRREEVCKEDDRMLCGIFRKAEEKAGEKEVQAYLDNEEALRKDYDSCREQVQKFSFHNQNSQWREAAEKYPCNFVKSAASRKFPAAGIFAFEKPWEWFTK